MPRSSDAAEKEASGPAPVGVLTAGAWPSVVVAVPVTLALPLVVKLDAPPSRPGLSVALLAAYGLLAVVVWLRNRPDARALLFTAAATQAVGVLAGGRALLPSTLALSGVLLLALTLCCRLAGFVVGLGVLGAIAVASSLQSGAPGIADPTGSVVVALLALGATGLAYAQASSRRERMYGDVFGQLETDLVVLESDAASGEWRTLAINPAALARLGLPAPGTGLGRGSLAGPEAHPDVGDALARACVTGQAQRLAVQDDAGRYSVTVIAAPPVVGSPRRALVSVQDRTGERRAVDALAAAERRFHGLLEAVPLALYWTDAEGRLQGCNARYARLCGHERPADVLAEGTGLRRPGGEAAARADVAALRGEPGEASAGPSPLHGPAGGLPDDQRWVETFRAPLRDDQGAVTGLVGALLDVTEARRSDDRFLDARRRSSAGRLARAFVHDFRNLLLVIDANARLLRDGVPARSPLLDDVDEIVGATARAAGLLARLEAFAAPSGGPARDPGPHELDAVVRDAATLLRRLVRAEVRLEEALEAPGARVAGDRARLDQAMLEAALSIADRLPSGGRLRIATSSLPPADAETLRLPGRGPFLLVTFEASLPATEPAFAHPLSDLSKAVATEFGAHLLADHAPGNGLRVRLVMPAAREAESEPDPARPARVALLVEDDDKLRSSLGRLLRGEGFDVHASGNANGAMAQLNALPDVDLLVADLLLPDGDGSDVARAVLGAHPRAGVILASATGLAEVRPAAETLAPAVPVVLSKPYSAAVLSGAIRRALDEARARPA